MPTRLRGRVGSALNWLLANLKWWKIEMKLYLLPSMAMLSVALMGGCSGPEDTRVEIQSSQIVQNAKATLEGMVKSGTAGSAITSLESDINGIKSSDKAKGEELHKDFLRLQAATKPEEVKAIAKEMLGKL